MGLGLIGGVGLLICAFAVWKVVDSAAAGRLDRNSLTGIRTAATNASDEAWLAGHRAARPATRIVAMLCGVLAVAMVVASFTFPGEEPHPLVIALVTAGYLAMLVGCVIIARAAGRAARSVEA